MFDLLSRMATLFGRRSILNGGEFTVFKVSIIAIAVDVLLVDAKAVSGCVDVVYADFYLCSPFYWFGFLVPFCVCLGEGRLIDA